MAPRSQAVPTLSLVAWDTFGGKDDASLLSTASQNSSRTASTTPHSTPRGS
eukprot:CAMPEP_0179324622 /NCGR_PEP_ID=MMETSP0797-20121207/60394_1 /TAXON_ID=47934 /ORGANISM="Dinophysis acuminata, Strain DAEP01" /LENGTH=50 /DNA_ID=CAMNT_0021036627 /DNA_START=67 /DNA_END=216 /DNA_ORIENTATION=-